MSNFTKPAGDDRRRPPLWAWLFAIPMATTLIARIGEKIELTDLVSYVADRWQALTHVIWSDLFQLLARWFVIEPTPSQLDLLTLTVLLFGLTVATLVRRALRTEEPAPAGTRAKYAFAASLAVLGAIFFSWPEVFFRESPWVGALVSASVGLFLGLCLSLVVEMPANIRAATGGGLFTPAVVIQSVVVLMLGVMISYCIALPTPDSSALAANPDAMAEAILATESSLAGVLALLFVVAVALTRWLAPLSVARAIAVVAGILAADFLLRIGAPIFEYLSHLHERA